MKHIVMFFLILFPPICAAKNTYICVAKSAIGFVMDQNTKEWSPSTFDVSKNKIVIARGKEYPWIVKNFGEKIPKIRCEKGFSDSVLNCRLGLSTLLFDRTTLRYLITYEIGYWSFDNESEDFKEGQNTPYMEVGECTEI